jgi:hypothetical protein
MYALQRSSGRHLIKLPPSDLTFWAVLCLNCGSAIRLDAGASRSPCLREQSPKPHFSRVQVSKVSLYLYLVVVGIRLTQVAPICSIQGWWKNTHEI